MQFEEAKKTLLLHSCGTLGSAGEVIFLEDGFVGSLRPYSGLKEENFHLVVEALLSVGATVHSSAQVDRELVLGLWSLCDAARIIGIDSKGMLQRNQLISNDDTTRLVRWVNVIEQSSLRILRGSAPHEVVHVYAAYVADNGCAENYKFLLPLFERAVGDSSQDEVLETVVSAIARLGSAGSSLLPSLYAAQKRSFTWYEPISRCTSEMRSAIGVAIEAIENRV